MGALLDRSGAVQKAQSDKADDTQTDIGEGVLYRRSDPFPGHVVTVSDYPDGRRCEKGNPGGYRDGIDDISEECAEVHKRGSPVQVGITKTEIFRRFRVGKLESGDKCCLGAVLWGKPDRRAEKTLLELLAAAVLLLICTEASLAQTGSGRSWAAAPIAATVTVAAPSRNLPAEIAELEIEIKQLAPLPLRDLVGRIADLVGLRASIEERPGRVLDGDVEMPPPVPFGLSMRGVVPVVLDEVARLSGYDWGWEDGRLLFYRYADVEQRRPERVPGGVPVGVLAAVADEEALEEGERPTLVEQDRRAAPVEVAPGPVADGVERIDPSQRGESDDAGERFEAGRVASEVPGKLEPGGRPVDPVAVASVEGQAPAGAAKAGAAGAAAWQVDPEVHGTVEGVLRAWAERAGWNVEWKSERRFGVGAAAEFPPGETEETGFLAAADALLAISPMRRTLTATAYPNKWLVVRDLGSAGQ